MHDYNNIKLLALRPARIQATWLGYAGSTGFGYRKTVSKNMQAIEFLIGDKYVIPPDLKFTQSYNENIVYLPFTYQPQDERQGSLLYDLVNHEKNKTIIIKNRKNIFSIQQKLSHRAHLIEQYSYNYKFTTPTVNIDSLVKKFWLVNLTRQAKIVPHNFVDWLHLLIEFQNCILVLMAESEDVISGILSTCLENHHLTLFLALQLQAAYHGVASSRLLFFKRLPRADYRSVLHVSDLFLDTYYYGAHTVASDSMFGTLTSIISTYNVYKLLILDID